MTTLRDPKGNTVMQTNLAYVELQTGMHYRDDEKWVAAQEIIEAYAGGAIARQGGHKVIFANNLNNEVVIDLETPDGKRLQSRVLGLGYLDSASGKSVLFAEVKDCPGQILGSNQVLYADAFTGFGADVRYTYTKAGLEQDVILRAGPPTPESFGLDSKTTRLQVLTEFLAAPAIETTKLAAAGGLEDQTLDFGAMQMPQGKAFTIGSDDASSDQVPVAKQWTVIDGRTILFEEIPMARLAEQLQALPAPKRTAFFRRKPVRQIASTILHLPARRTAKPAPQAMQMAKLSPPLRGVVLDYSLLSSAPTVTLQGDTTYYVSGTVNLSGTTTIEGGTVVKFASGTTPKISILGPVVCKTGPYRPAVFTAKDDNSVGEAFGTGSPGSTKYGNGLTVNVSGSALSYLRFCYANSAIRLGFSSGQVDLAHLQVVNCLYGVDFNGNSADTVNMDNSLFYLISNVTKSGYDNLLRGRHVTIDTCVKMFAIGNGNHNGEVHLTNSILATVTALGNADVFDGTHNGFYSSPQFGDTQIPASAFPFETVGVGNGAHYLASASGFLAQGTPDIPAALRTVLKTKTVYKPTERTSDFTTDEVLDRNPAVVRNATCTPDLGFHYDLSL